MSAHPVNVFLRFLLELAALVAVGMWGYHLSGVIGAVLFPLIFAALWGVFAVRGDPSRSGKTVVNVSGKIRLILELALFSIAVRALFVLDHSLAGWILGILLLIHYVASYDRVIWLVKKRVV